jgi:hypothetical protein
MFRMTLARGSNFLPANYGSRTGSRASRIPPPQRSLPVDIDNFTDYCPFRVPIPLLARQCALNGAQLCWVGKSVTLPTIYVWSALNEPARNSQAR